MFTESWARSMSVMTQRISISVPPSQSWPGPGAVTVTTGRAELKVSPGPVRVSPGPTSPCTFPAGKCSKPTRPHAAASNAAEMAELDGSRPIIAENAVCLPLNHRTPIGRLLANSLPASRQAESSWAVSAKAVPWQWWMEVPGIEGDREGHGW